MKTSEVHIIDQEQTLLNRSTIGSHTVGDHRLHIQDRVRTKPSYSTLDRGQTQANL